MFTILFFACTSIPTTEAVDGPVAGDASATGSASVADEDRSGLSLDISSDFPAGLVRFSSDDGTLSEWHASGAEALLALRDVVIEDQESACPGEDQVCLEWYDNLIDRIDYAVAVVEAPPPPYSDEESDEVEDCELHVEVTDYPWSSSKGGGAYADFNCGRSSDEDNQAAARVTIKTRTGATRGTDREELWDDEAADVDAWMNRKASDDKCDSAAYVLHTDSGLALYKRLTTCY